MTDYCDSDKVYLYSGLTSEDISEANVNSLITDASREIDRICGNIRHIRNEFHKVDGKLYRFRIGGREGDAPKTITEVMKLIRKGKDVVGAYSSSRVWQTFPAGTDDWTDAVTDWTASGTTITHDTTYYKSGLGSVKIVDGGASGTATFPSTLDLNIDIDDWCYLFFHYRVSATTAITIRLHEDASNYREYTFTPSYANSWHWAFVDITDEATMTETGDPSVINYIVIQPPASMTLYIDGLCLSDGYGLENPSGDYGYIIFQEEPEAFDIYYHYDQFTPVPNDIAQACAFLVSSYIYEILSGTRLKETVGEYQVDDMQPVRDSTRGLTGLATRWREKAETILKRYGHDIIMLFEDWDTY